MALTGVGEWTQRGAAQAPPTAITIEPQPVYRGCNSIVVQAPLNTPWADIVAQFSNPESVQVIWRFDNASKRYRGVYFANPLAPVDPPAATDVAVQGLFFCVLDDGMVG